MKRTIITALLLTVMGVLPLAAQDAAVKQADASFQSQEWNEAAAGYRAVVETEPENGRAWYRLGVSLYNLKDYAPAAAAFERAGGIGFASGNAHYNAASSFALAGQGEAALTALDRAASAGFANVQTLEADADLASVRDLPAFAEILQAVRVNARPCEHLPEYRQFDFWIGDWEVRDAQGRKVGENRIERLDNGCVLWENWTGSGGGTGHSINYYDHARGKYVQQWVSSGAGIIPAEGGFEDGAMRLTGERILRNGTRRLYRGTWTPLEDGRVRQFLELSSDGGETWNVWFDGYYSRKQQTGEGR